MSTKIQHGSELLRGALVAGVILAFSVVLKLLSPSHISAELAQRLGGCLLGLVVVAYSNAVPKGATPLARAHCDAATEQSIRRFAGWSLVLGGMAYSAASMFAPFESSVMLAAGVLGFSLALVIARYAWVISRRPRG